MGIRSTFWRLSWATLGGATLFACDTFKPPADDVSEMATDDSDDSNVATDGTDDVTADSDGTDDISNDVTADSDGNDGSEASDDANEDDSDGSSTDSSEAALVNKLDLLFVVDNSTSMQDKHVFFQRALPELVERFVSPVCFTPEWQAVPRSPGATTCPPGSQPEFTAITDVNIGVITSSLGGFGSDTDCLRDARGGTYDQAADMAWLVGSLPRGASAGTDFVAWREGDVTALSANLSPHSEAVGGFGCEWEATMEAWVRFLVDPYPYQEIVRAPCNANDTSNSCGKPRTDPNGVPALDEVLLAQREAFLRMDSVLAVIMISDENDCSFKVGGQQVLLADTLAADGRQTTTYKGSADCSSDPNSACCHTCGATPPSGCDGAGCESPLYPEPSGVAGEFFEDQTPLRCYKQRQRFGLDFLFPVERYANALSLTAICPSAPDLEPDNCPSTVVDNPVFKREVNGKVVTRPKNQVYLAGILGVPWQDLAKDPTGSTPLQYKPAGRATDGSTIDWDTLLGVAITADRAIGDLGRLLYPTLDSGIDPLMVESVQPRTGTHPTGEALAGPYSAFMANSINGHEWSPLEGADLQYACIFELREPKQCPSQLEVMAAEDEQAARQPACVCTRYANTNELDYNTPLCQTASGYEQTQTHAQAYPSIRQLQALELFSELNPTSNSIVASICPINSTDPDSFDYGYRPAIEALVDRVKVHFTPN